MSAESESENFIEFLENTHQFPGPYTLKAIGKNPDGFPQSVLAAIRDELSMTYEPRHELKHTPNGRHVSITVTLTVHSPQSVVQVYARLKTLDDLVMLM